MTRPRVAIIHPQLGCGGSEARALWAIDAMHRDYDVTLITAAKVPLQQLNQYYGTDLSLEKFKIAEVRMPLGLHHSARFAALRGVYVQRYLKRVAPEFDVMISAYNPCDFGVRGIQFIADFSFIEEWRFALDPSLRTYRQWWYGESPLRRAYLALCRFIFKPDPETWKTDVIVANSDWSAGVLRREFGIEARTVYPPVWERFPSVPWEARENGFVCVGRVVPEKRMDAVIRILGKVRQHRHDVHLHVLGALDRSPYGRQLQKLADENRDWVFLEGLTYGDRKRRLLAGHRYGINARENEPFGIAPAELVRAGCITFVPNSGGQTESVNHPLLLFENDDDGVKKLLAVLENPALQATLREHLRAASRDFSVERFQETVRGLVAEFLAEKASQNPAVKRAPGAVLNGVHA